MSNINHMSDLDHIFFNSYAFFEPEEGKKSKECNMEEKTGGDKDSRRREKRKRVDSLRVEWKKYFIHAWILWSQIKTTKKRSGPCFHLIPPLSLSDPFPILDCWELHNLSLWLWNRQLPWIVTLSCHSFFVLFIRYRLLICYKPVTVQVLVVGVCKESAYPAYLISSHCILS